MNRAIGVVRDAKSRLSRYGAVVRWLVELGARHAPVTMVAVPFLSTAAVGLQIISFVSVAHFLGSIPLNAGASLPPVETPLGNISPAVFIAAVVLLLAMSGVARFGAARLSIDAFNKLPAAITAEILSKLESFSDPIEKWRLLRKFSRRDIVRVASGDGTLCGMSLRILLDSTIHVFFLIAGCLFFLWLSPTIFAGLVAIVVVCAILAYPMNVRLVGLTKSMETSQKIRPGQMMDIIDAALRPTVQVSIDATNLLASASGGVKATAKRLMMSETLRLGLGLIFAAIVGGALWLISRDAGRGSLDPQRLVIFFFAFRFTYQGLQGLLMSLMNVNRFMPSLLRAESLFRAIDRARTPGQDEKTAARDPQLQTSAHRYEWRVAGPDDANTSGVFEAGRIYIIAERPNSEADIVYRLLSILDHGQALFSRHYMDGRIGGDNVEATVAAIEARERAGTPMIVIDKRGMPSLSAIDLARMRTALSQSILLVIMPWGTALEPSLDAGTILVSSGQAIGFAGDSAQMSAKDWERAKAVYDGRAGRDGPSAEGAIEDELEDEVM